MVVVHVEIVDCPVTNSGSFHSYVKLPDGSHRIVGIPGMYQKKLGLTNIAIENYGHL